MACQSCVVFDTQDMGNRRSGAPTRKKANTRKIVGRLTYSPAKHKQKFLKTQRDKLASRAPAKAAPPQPQEAFKIFGSLNINGLDEEAHWAVTELLEKHSLDVRNKKLKLEKLLFNYFI